MADKEKDIKEENYDLKEDYEGEEEIITLYNENTGKNEDFRVVEVLEYKEKDYVFLNPVDPSEEIAEDEVIICEIGENDKGEEYVLPVEDEATLQAVYDLYVKEYNDALAEEGKNN